MTISSCTVVSSVFSLWYNQRVLTNFKMRTLCLFLLLLFTIPMSDAAELNNDVLSYVVVRFLRASGYVSHDESSGHVAFLVALPASQCGTPHGPVRLKPTRIHLIPHGVRTFLNYPGQNYLAASPNSGSRCPESKLLYPGQIDENRNAAQILQNLLNNRTQNNDQPVGCIILYTTYSPCLDHCFTNTGNCEIITPLQNSPFQDIWTEPHIHKYFAFSQIYASGEAPRPDQEIRDKLAAVRNLGFHVRRCNRVGRTRCTECSAPEYCISQAPTIDVT
ncbi:uncharacterized protein LOC125450054 isoform X2 [Stegostoma tigrinum]|uniref:uncharacterized protein LOC125450054 isoform X2 n=1 Tax=Stegostoma tigrinum TaxID=3053191 RepID=UPI00286FD1F7|nr:uncharacterized protein LOC125450054 isoform X2 [Stegostoma tigrinum]